MSHQYLSSKRITAVEADVNTLQADVLALEGNIADFVAFTETGADAASIATALAALIANLISAGLMKAS